MLCGFGGRLQAEDWKAKIESAKSGETVTLPTGTFKMSEVQIPSGVKITGSGDRESIIDAAGAQRGLMMKDVAGVSLRNLRVSNASVANLAVEGSRDITISGIALDKSLTGLLVVNSTGVRVENSILADNRTGASFSKSGKVAIVNNLLYDNGSLGLSLVDPNVPSVANDTDPLGSQYNLRVINQRVFF